MVIHSAVRRTLLTTVIRLFVLSMSAMDVLREARLQSAMRWDLSKKILVEFNSTGVSNLIRDTSNLFFVEISRFEPDRRSPRPREVTSEKREKGFGTWSSTPPSEGPS